MTATTGRGAGKDPSAAIVGSFDTELLQLLARQGRRLPIPVFVVDAVIAGMAAQHVGWTLPLLWMGLVVLVLVTRWTVFGRLPDLDTISVQRRLQLAIALNAISGATQGLSLGFFFVLPGYERAIQSMLLIGFCAGSVARTGGYMPVFLAYLIPTVVPLSVAWAVTAAVSERPWIEGSIALLILLLGGILAALARDAYRMFRESFDIRLQQVELNGRLRAALDAAEAASRAKTRFLASASHDLRQPMHSLTVFAAALEMRPLDERSRGIVAHMNEALHELSSELDALLDVSKLDAGLVRVHVTAVPLKPLIERLLDTFRAHAHQKQLSLQAECPDDIHVKADKTLLERVVRNLIDNALKYTHSGGVSITARADDDTVELTVADTGPGIPEAEHGRVFEEFYQLGNPERDRARGLGLGLAIVKRLVELLEIRIDLYSSPSSGTRFVLTLSRVSPVTESVTAVQPAIPPPLSGLHILVVDDEGRVRTAMRELLEHHGCRVTEAASTAEALDRSRADRPDVLIADFRLRGSDTGTATVRAIRERYPRMPAILLSGDTAPERLREASAADVTFMHKPVAVEELRLAILEACGRRSPA